MLGLMKDLCEIDAVSGNEKPVEIYIRGKLKNVECDIKTDPLGNVLVFKKGKRIAKNKIMFAAHMDEVGLIVSYITDDGLLRVQSVGGILPSVLFGRQFKFANGTIGVIGGKAIHHLSDDEKEKQPEIDDLYLDIGASTKTEAKKRVSAGDTACFVSDFFEFGAGLIKSKAIDDRFGCAVMLDMIMSELEFDSYFAFTVQEEIGTRGAGVAAYNLKPDFAVVLEATTACDIADVSGGKQICKLGEGTVISFMDKSTIYDCELYKIAFETAKENKLKCQTKTQVAGGNDSGAIHKSVGGIRTLSLSAPCRYLHSPSCVVKRLDCLETRILTEKIFDKISGL